MIKKPLAGIDFPAGMAILAPLPLPVPRFSITQLLKSITFEVVFLNSIHSSLPSPLLPAQLISLITISPGFIVGVGEGVNEGKAVEAWKLLLTEAALLEKSAKVILTTRRAFMK